MDFSASRPPKLESERRKALSGPIPPMADFVRLRVQSFKESICATSINIIMCINLIICSLAFFQEIVPNSALRLYFAYIPHEMHEDLLSRQQ